MSEREASLSGPALPPGPMPGGTLTFLFTDLEGSTRLLRLLGRDRYADVLADHGQALRAAFAASGGREIDTQGDSFFYVFPSATVALASAAGGQRALAAREWPEGARVAVRMGVHTGEAAVADNRYFGLAVHRASRICSAAHGGQILVSRTTRDVAEDALPADLSLRSLGRFQLKDIDRPEELYQLVVEGLPSSYPNEGDQEEPPAFSGREQELADAAQAAVAGASRSSELALRVADAERERAVSLLREHTAAGRLDLEEFSERVGEAYAARTQGELERVTRELPVPLAPTARRRAARLTLCVFGHAVRRGLLRLRRFAVAISIFGDLDLDLRTASIDNDRATVFVFALLGNADVYVPEGIDVDAGGIALGGHCRDWGRDEPQAGSPQLRVRVLTILGTADVWRVPAGARGGYRELMKVTRRRQGELER